MNDNDLTPEQWQRAVDCAVALLTLAQQRRDEVLDALWVISITGCQGILNQGAHLGITPSTAAVERLVADLIRVAGESAMDRANGMAQEPLTAVGATDAATGEYAASNENLTRGKPHPQGRLP